MIGSGAWGGVFDQAILLKAFGALFAEHVLPGPTSGAKGGSFCVKRFGMIWAKKANCLGNGWNLQEHHFEIMMLAGF
jgi:hypothetical protein